MQSVASDFNTNSSEDLEAQRRRFRQYKQRESLNRQYSDEKHPKKLSARQSAYSSQRSSIDQYGESLESVSKESSRTLSYGSETSVSYYDQSVRSSRYFTKRQLSKLKRIVNNFLIFRFKSKLLIQFQKWKRLCGQRTVLNQRKCDFKSSQAALKPETIEIFDDFNSRSDLQSVGPKKKVAFVIQAQSPSRILANELTAIKQKGLLRKILQKWSHYA